MEQLRVFYNVRERLGQEELAPALEALEGRLQRHEYFVSQDEAANYLRDIEKRLGFRFPQKWESFFSLVGTPNSAVYLSFMHCPKGQFYGEDRSTATGLACCIGTDAAIAAGISCFQFSLSKCLRKTLQWNKAGDRSVA